VKDDLALEEPVLLEVAYSQYEGWSEMKNDFQEYYDVINIVHLRFPELLPLSISAWQSVASARSQAPSSTGHSENTRQSQNQPVLAEDNVDGLNGRVKFGCLGSLKLGWKRVDNAETEKRKKSKKRLVKRKISKEREARGSGEC